MEKRFANWNNTNSKIGDLFIEFSPYFMMYQQYLSNCAKAMEYLKHLSLKKNSKFVKFCLKLGVKYNGETLQSLLILPIQRLPRYSLCLQQIIKHTASAHLDMKNLRQALSLVQNVNCIFVCKQTFLHFVHF